MTDLNQAAADLEQRIRDHRLVREWVRPIENGETYNGPWVCFAVDPLFIEYKDRSLSSGLSISTRTGEARLLLVWPYRRWRQGISDVELDMTLTKAIRLCEYLWNNHLFTQEGSYPNVRVTLEAP
jgi:hypothetical protein